MHRWVALYQSRHIVGDLNDQARTGRPREAEEWDAPLLAKVLRRDPRTVGYQATTWTVPLLSAYLREEHGCRVSSDTLRRRLHEYG